MRRRHMRRSRMRYEEEEADVKMHGIIRMEASKRKWKEEEEA